VWTLLCGAFAVLGALWASSPTTTLGAATLTYDIPTIERHGVHALDTVGLGSAQFTDAPERSASPPNVARATSTTPPHSLVATNTVSPWSLGPSPRGFAIEEALGGNLPRSFPTIDSFANGTATSIKSIDLTASSYQSAGRLTSRLNGYVDGVAGFDGAVFDGVRIAPGATTARELIVAVQPGVASSAQQAALAEIVRYGASNGVTVRVVPVP